MLIALVRQTVDPLRLMGGTVGKDWTRARPFEVLLTLVFDTVVVDPIFILLHQELSLREG